MTAFDADVVSLDYSESLLKHALTDPNPNRLFIRSSIESLL